MDRERGGLGVEFPTSMPGKSHELCGDLPTTRFCAGDGRRVRGEQEFRSARDIVFAGGILCGTGGGDERAK